MIVVVFVANDWFQSRFNDSSFGTKYSCYWLYGEPRERFCLELASDPSTFAERGFWCVSDPPCRGGNRRYPSFFLARWLSWRCAEHKDEAQQKSFPKLRASRYCFYEEKYDRRACACERMTVDQNFENACPSTKFVIVSISIFGDVGTRLKVNKNLGRMWRRGYFQNSVDCE